MEREVGGGIGMGNTCKPMAVSFQCMTKSTTIKKKKCHLSIIPQERYGEKEKTDLLYITGNYNHSKKATTKYNKEFISRI